MFAGGLCDLTFIYRQVLITSCPLNHLSEIHVDGLALVLPNEHKATTTLWQPLAFCIHLLPRQVVELRCAGTGLISQVRELPGEISCSHLLLRVGEKEWHLQAFKFRYPNPAPGFI